MKVPFSFKAAIFGAVALFGLTIGASAQTSPNWTYRYVPTPAQWKAIFASKQDWLGAPPLLTSGGTMTGPLVTTPSITGNSGFNIAPGIAPSSPNNGDMWTTAAGLYVEINGTTIGPLSGATSSSFGNTSPITVSFPSGVVTYACPTCGVTGNPLSQFASTTSAQLAGVISNETGTGLLVFNTSPSLVTPSLGAASATSLASGPVAITSASTSALAVGPNGTTNPVLQVDSSTSSQATGLSIKGDVTGGKTVIQTIDSGAATGLDINAKATGGLRLQAYTGAGPIYLGLVSPTVNIGTSGTATLNIGSAGLASGTLTIAGSSGGASTILAPSTGGGTATLFPGSDTIAGIAATQALTNKTLASSTDVLGGVTMTLGSDADGDIYYRSGGLLTRLPKGANGTALEIVAGLPSWQAVTGIGTVTSVGLTAGTGISLGGAGPNPITGSGNITITNAGVTTIAGNAGAFTLGGLLTNSTNLLQVVAAVESDQKTGSSTTLAVTPSAQQYHPSALQAHGYFNGSTGAAVGTAYNITSLTVSGSGQYTVNFGTNFWADTSYVCHPTPSGVPVAFESGTHTRSAWSFTTQNTSFAGINATNINISCSGPLT